MAVFSVDQSSAPGDTIVLAKPAPGLVLQKGDAGFDAYLHSLYDDHEAAALAQLNTLKHNLRTCPADDYWRVLLRGITRITRSQMVWVTRRLKVDIDGSTELPSIGEPDSAFHCVAWYYAEHNGNEGFGRNLRSETYTSPSAYMKFNKVFLLPTGLDKLCPDYVYASRLPIRSESYFGVPLFAETDCIGHVAMAYDEQGLKDRKLGWGFLEMVMRAFEDSIAERIIAETEPANMPVPLPDELKLEVVPPQPTPASVFKPYAQSLSHELRTPMQGVVGMLDVMQTSLLEAQDASPSKAELILRRLQEDIEMTQDSCRRAVEAADNVVQAYDLNMGMPLTPPQYALSSLAYCPPAASLTRPQIRKKSRDLAILRGSAPPKVRTFEYSLADYSQRQQALQLAVQESEDLTAAYGNVSSRGRQEAVSAWENKSRSTSPTREADAGLHHVHLPDLLEWVINESLKIGGRPKSAEAYEVEYGQVISATFQQSNDALITKTIEWRVEPSVPDTIRLHERNLAKVISCVFQNALKFTREGRIHIHARVIPDTQRLNIIVSDSGPGIHPAFQSHIFEPFSRENDSITRDNEGLGLGLLVAKSLSHKLGGDLQLVRSDRDGPLRGSDFEINVPFTLDPSRPASRAGHRATTALSNKRRISVDSKTDQQDTPKVRKLSDDQLSTYSQSSPIDFNGKDPFAPKLLGKPAEPSPPTSPHVPVQGETPTRVERANSDDKATPRAKRATTPSSDVRTLNRNLAAQYPLRILVAEDQPLNRKLLVKMLTKLGYDPKTQIVEAYDGADALRRVVCARKRRDSHDDHCKGIIGAGNGDCGRASGDADSAALGPIDIILMDLWMPVMDGYEAAERILSLYHAPLRPTQRRSITEPSSVSAAADLAGSAPAKFAAAALVARDRDRAAAAATATATAAAALPQQHQPMSAPPLPPAPTPTPAQPSVEELPPVIMAVTADTTDGAAERALRAGMQGCMLKPFKLKELERLVVDGWTRRMNGAGRAPMPATFQSAVATATATATAGGN